VWHCAQLLILQHLTRMLAGLRSGVESERGRDAPEISAPSKSAMDERLNARGCAAMGCLSKSDRDARSSPDGIRALKPPAAAGSERTSRCAISERTLGIVAKMLRARES
jgi:hypothetical protein